MQNIKLHEATKQFKISNKLAMFFLEKKNIPVKSHSSVISMEQLELLREFSTNQDKYTDILDAFKKEGSKKKKVKTAEKEPAEPKKEEKKPEKPVKEETKKEAKPEEKKPEKKEPKIPPVVEKKPEPPKKVKKPEVAPKPPPAAAPAKKKVIIEKKPEPPPPPRPAPKAKKEVIFQKRPHHNKRMHPGRKKFKPPQTGKPKERPVIVKKRKEFTDLPELIQVPDYITYKELCEKLTIKIKDVDERLRESGAEFQSAQVLSSDEVRRICQEFKVEVDIIPFEDFVFSENIEKSKATPLPRAPIVTVMGHVDHGKTTLLDSLRKTHVAEREAGGITQSIGAYRLKIKDNEIVFIDTPGHEAFTNLRARGAQVTDIVILVVAANEGAKPQTIEAINHAQAAEVPIIVAINKMDMSGADPNKVKQDLSNHNILVEDWGGDIVAVEISAKEGTNLDTLLEMISLVSEMQELKAYGDIPARGTVIESRLDPKLGPVATVLIQDGKIKRGDHFICGNSFGKIKSIFDDRGNTLSTASVPMPAEIMGFEEVPDSGDRFQIIDDIEKARKIIQTRKLKVKETRKDEIIAEKKASLQNLFKKMETDQSKEFPLIIKADTYGSSEVLERVLTEKSTEKLKVNIVHKGIGNITEGDILLASAASAVIIGFNVKAPQKIMIAAKNEQIEIRLYNVIYHLMEDMDQALKGEIEPEYVTREIGKIEVLQKFKISKIGVVAGCVVRDGKVTNKSKLKVLRGDDLVFEGEIETLRRIKDEVTEVHAGTECGIKIKNFNAIEVGDILEAFELALKE